MFSVLRLAATVLLATLLAVWANLTPAPIPATAPASVFSAARARADLDWIAPEPHPTGSPANARVRDRLIARLAELGMKAAVQHVEGVAGQSGENNFTIENVTARLPGENPALPALLLMCHYDSVPGSPGAADDGAGVASLLEVARALRAEPTQHDVFFLFSDGEEPGLLGAREFFAHAAQAKSIFAAINLEARGGGGRAYLFETGEHSDQLVRAFAHSARDISSSSFAAFVYDHMPNGTDFTVAKRAGHAGFNFAFIADPAQYHTPIATPAALEIGSLQNIGALTLASVRSIDAQSSIETAPSTLAWSDLLGQRLVAYGAVGGWLIVGVVVALLIVTGIGLARRRQGLRVSRGVWFVLALLVVSGLALFIAGKLSTMPRTQAHFLHLVARVGRFEVAVLLIALSACLFAAHLTNKSGDAEGAWFGLLGLGTILLIVAQALAPRLAVALAWPLLVSAAGIVAVRRQSWLARTWSLATAILSLALTLSWAHGVYLGVGLFIPPALVVFVLIACFAIYPLCVHAVRASRSLAPILFGLGAIVALSLRL